MSFKLTGPRTTTLRSAAVAGRHLQILKLDKNHQWAELPLRFVGSTLKSPVKLASLMSNWPPWYFLPKPKIGFLASEFCSLQSLIHPQLRSQDVFWLCGDLNIGWWDSCERRDQERLNNSWLIVLSYQLTLIFPTPLISEPPLFSGSTLCRVSFCIILYIIMYLCVSLQQRRKTTALH